MLTLLLTTAVATSTVSTAEQWTRVAEGIHLRRIRATRPSPVGDRRITVVRVNPKRWTLTIITRSRDDARRGRTARQWAKRSNLVVATNAGMFAPDYVKHVGYLEHGSSTSTSPG